MNLIGHIMSCDYCNGRHEKYCDLGRQLWVDSQAQYVVGLESKENRRTALDELLKDNPKWSGIIESRVKELWREREVK